MTMPTERTRALLWAGGFLIELARDKRLPVEVRRRAVVIARHFPTKEDVTDLAFLQPIESGVNRPGFSRHLQALHYGNHGGVYERQAVFG